MCGKWRIIECEKIGHLQLFWLCLNFALFVPWCRPLEPRINIIRSQNSSIFAFFMMLQVTFQMLSMLLCLPCVVSFDFFFCFLLLAWFCRVKRPKLAPKKRANMGTNSRWFIIRTNYADFIVLAHGWQFFLWAAFKIKIWPQVGLNVDWSEGVFQVEKMVEGSVPNSYFIAPKMSF